MGRSLPLNRVVIKGDEEGIKRVHTEMGYPATSKEAAVVEDTEMNGRGDR